MCRRNVCRISIAVISVSAHYWEIIVIRQAGPHLLSKQVFAFPFWILLCGFQKAGKEAKRWVMVQPKMGSGCLPLKSQQRGQVGGKESLLYFGFQQLGQGEDIGVGVYACPVVNSQPHTYNQWARAFIGRGRWLYAETAQSALTVILKLVMWWSDQCHLDCFRYS